MRMIRPSDFVGTRAWEAIDIERLDDATVRLHWTDRPYKWHVNDGPEVFVVLDGEVDMLTRGDRQGEQVWTLRPGDIFHAEAGDECAPFSRSELGQRSLRAAAKQALHEP